MTRGARKTGGFRKRAQREVLRRKSKMRPVKTTILIVGEGEKTEPNYFRGMKNAGHVSNRFSLKVKKAQGISQEEVVETALKHKSQAKNRGEYFDEVWCVLDVEEEKKRNSLNRAKNLAKKNGIKLCLSNPCFEIWLLYHLQSTASSFIDCDAVITKLDKQWQKRFNQEYRKADAYIYDRISMFTEEAIANAESVLQTHHKNYAGQDIENIADCNPSTEVCKLVNYLINPYSATTK